MSVLDAMHMPSLDEEFTLRTDSHKVGAADFELLRVLGQGGYGKVCIRVHTHLLVTNSAGLSSEEDNWR